MEKQKLKAILEAVLFASPEPVSLGEFKKILRKAEPAAEAETPVVPTVEEITLSDVDPADEPTLRLVEVPPEDISESAPEISPDAQLAQMSEALKSEISKGEIREALNEMAAEYAENPAKGFELVEVANAWQFRTKASMAVFVKSLQKLPRARLSPPAMETLSLVAYQQPVSRAKIEEVRGVDSGGVLKTLLERDLVRIVGRSEEPGRPILYGTTAHFLELFSLSGLSDLPNLKDLESYEPGPGAVLEAGGDDEIDPELELDTSIMETVAQMDEESAELIGELEDSMKSLKSLEQSIFEKPSDENPSDGGIPPPPEAS